MNKLEWNLNEIFANNQLFYEEINEVKQLLNDIEKYKNIELNTDLLLKLLEEKWQVKEKSNKILVYGSLMYYKNVNDDECIKLKRIAEDFDNEVNNNLKFIDRMIIELGYDKITSFIEENSKLDIYKLSLCNLFRVGEHIQPGEINQKIKENNDIVNQQLGIYNNLIRDIDYGSISIDEKKVKITATNFMKYISSKDREIRKQTYFMVNSAFKKEKDSFAEILNKIYCCRINNSHLEKYSSVLEKILFEENIDSRIISRLIESVNKLICWV